MKIKKVSDLTKREYEMMMVARNNAEQLAEVAWDRMIKEIDYISKEWTGDEILSAYTTFLCNFSCRIIDLMKYVADSDDTCRSYKELIDCFVSGVYRSYNIEQSVPAKIYEDKHAIRGLN